MRAVLDTNILVRAVPGRTGPAREVLELLSVSLHVLVTALTPLQRRILQLLGLPAATYGS